jgi:uncharacterized membrane protein
MVVSMGWRVFLFACALGLGAGRLTPARAERSGGARDLGAEVRAVFAARCTACHGPSLAKPRGRFGYVLDLPRVAANREMVVPEHPDESELWDLVRTGEMPPSDSPTGPTTDAEKEIVRAWIAAGAPPASSSTAPLVDNEAVSRTGDVPFVPHLLGWLGRFHLLLLHFPIALLTAAAAGEGWAAWRRGRVPSPAVRYCLLLGAAAVLPTVLFGWFHAASGNGAASPRILSLHRWLGTAAAAWAVATALLAERDERRGVRSLAVRVLVLAGALLVGLAGHLGGVLAHGEDFFDW